MGWVDVAPRAAVAKARMLEVEAAGRALLIYDIDGTVFATSAICPHHAAWLSQGSISGDCIDCPRHFGRFHIPTGRQLNGPPCPDLRTYPVQVANDRVLVDV
jgi:3-phenylpropionate/trans-cinnamate dioxygenase ferredoxin component